MITGRNIFLILIGLAMVFLITTYTARCARARPVTKHQENRKEIMKADSVESRRETLYRSELESTIQAYQDSLRKTKANYKVIVQKDVRIEYRYRHAPSIAACDSVIDSKNMRIGELETMTAQQDKTVRLDDSLLASYAGSLHAKDQIIGQLNEGYEQVTKDLEKALRPKRFGIGPAIGVVIAPSLRPAPAVGFMLSYNLVRL